MINFSKIFLLPTLLLALILSFQNCSRLQQQQPAGSGISPTKTDNGGGYSGIQGEYYRLVPNFKCEKQESAVASISVEPGSIRLIENKALMCGAAQEDLSADQIDVSIFQNDIIGYKEGIFENKTENPSQIPASLVEVWCRDSADEKGIETVVYYDRLTQQAVSRIYYATLDEHGFWNHQQIHDFSVARTISAKKVVVKDSNGFEITVYRDQPSERIGLFKGQLSSVINNQLITRATECRLGGSLDPQMWPAKQIVDLNVYNFVSSPDKSAFAFSAWLSGRNGMFMGLSNGKSLAKVIANDEDSINNGDFTFSADGQSLIYEIDKNNLASELRAQSVTDGTHVTLNPIGASVLNVQPYTSLLKGRTIFTWGFPTAQLYSVRSDGSGLLNITPNFGGGQTPIYFIPPMNTETAEYVLMFGVHSEKGPLQYAVAIDGSGAVELPAMQGWTLAGGSLALSVGNGVLRILNLKTGAQNQVPFQLTNWSLSRDGQSLIGYKTSSSGQISLSVQTLNGSESALCGSLSSSQLKVFEIENNKFLVIDYDSSRQILSLHRASTTGECVKVNSAVISAPDLKKIYNVQVAPDKNKVLVLLKDDAWLKSQLVYIPLNGQSTFIVDTPLYADATIFDFGFLADSKTVFFLGPQLRPGDNRLFIWTAP